MEYAHIRDIEPAIEAAYERHTKNDNRTTNPTGPLDPIQVIQKATDSVGMDVRDSYGRVADLAADHYKKMDELSLDYVPALRSSVLVNLLTEDNLIHYHETLGDLANNSEIFRIWLNRWSSEEHRHGTIIRDHAIHAGIIGTSGAIIDHAEYSDGLASQHQSGMEIRIEDEAEGFSYLTFQEDATVTAHTNERPVLDPAGRYTNAKVASDETRHTMFYHDAEQAVIDASPDAAVIGIAKTKRRFAMPGRLGIPGFDAHAETIAKAGLFDAGMIAAIQAKHIEKWGIADLELVSDEAKKAQAYLLRPSPFIRVQKSVDIAKERMVEEAIKNGTRLPFILGLTAKIEGKELVRIV